MPYWIEQTEGPHKAAIDEAVQMYREGASSPKATWGKLSALYLKVAHRQPPSLEDHQERGSVEYMIRTWFPMYANLWYEGTREQCHREVARLNRAGCGEFATRYEY